MSLPRAPLPKNALTLIGAINWRRVTEAQAIAAAELWNAGANASDIGGALGLNPKSIPMLIGKLVQIGLEMRRATPTGRRLGGMGLRATHAQEVEREAAYVARRRRGASQADLGEDMALSPYTAVRLEKSYRHQTFAEAYSRDGSVPKFANHDRHVADVVAAGGFWAFSERRRGLSHVFLCMPIVPGARPA